MSDTTAELSPQAKAVKKVLAKSGRTADDLAKRAGFAGGRSISRTLGVLVANGVANRIVGSGNDPSQYCRAESE